MSAELAIEPTFILLTQSSKQCNAESIAETNYKCYVKIKAIQKS